MNYYINKQNESNINNNLLKMYEILDTKKINNKNKTSIEERIKNINVPILKNIKYKINDISKYKKEKEKIKLLYTQQINLLKLISKYQKIKSELDNI
jgi:hypothetical protein